MRIDKYELGATIGQITRVLIERDSKKYINGDFDEEFDELIIKTLMNKQRGLLKIYEHPVLGPMLDATLIPK